MKKKAKMHTTVYALKEDILYWLKVYKVTNKKNEKQMCKNFILDSFTKLLIEDINFKYILKIEELLINEGILESDN